MSLLDKDVDIKPVFVGHMYDVKYTTSSFSNDEFAAFNMNGIWREPDFSKLDGLLGHRQTKAAYAAQFKRYVIAAWMTCFVGEGGKVHVHDDRFNKIIRMVNKVYGFPMGTLEVEFTLNPGVLKIWHKEMMYISIGAFRSSLTKPDIFRGNDRSNVNEHMDHGYYAVKPQAITSHLMAVERLLKYDVESNILEL